MEDKRRVGAMWLGQGHEVFIEQDQDGKFINPEDEIKDWVHCLNNPWSGTSMSYEVTPNYSESGWMATKTIIVYDFIDAKICAGGATPQEAITACEEAIKVLTEKYYEEEDDADSEE